MRTLLTQVGGANVVARVTDQGGLFAEQSFVLTIKAASANQPPTVAASSTPTTITLPTNSVALYGTVTDDGLPNPPGTVTVTWSKDSGPGPVTFGNANAASTTATFAAAGTYGLKLTASDGERSASAIVTVTVNLESAPPLPPDPATVAPQLDPTAVTGLQVETEFLYTGANPIQTGVAAGTIDPKRVAVIRGEVRDRDSGNPLSGVTVRIKDHPEYGQTLSRADGVFDLAVNGGGQLVLDYVRAGYLPVQRPVEVPWRDYLWAEPVAMIALDSHATAVALQHADWQIARGSVVTDAGGSRQATMLFPAGTGATLVQADGTRQTLTTLTVRATEYTVGERGPDAMPGALPPASGYTYAVELSADEALAAGAERVEFSQPLPFYVDNFPDFPVGEPVPVGWYDRGRRPGCRRLTAGSSRFSPSSTVKPSST